MHHQKGQIPRADLNLKTWTASEEEHSTDGVREEEHSMDNAVGREEENQRNGNAPRDMHPFQHLFRLTK